MQVCTQPIPVNGEDMKQELSTKVRNSLVPVEKGYGPVCHIHVYAMTLLQTDIWADGAILYWGK